MLCNLCPEGIPSKGNLPTVKQVGLVELNSVIKYSCVPNTSILLDDLKINLL